MRLRLHPGGTGGSGGDPRRHRAQRIESRQEGRHEDSVSCRHRGDRGEREFGEEATLDPVEPLGECSMGVVPHEDFVLVRVGGGGERHLAPEDVGEQEVALRPATASGDVPGRTPLTARQRSAYAEGR